MDRSKDQIITCGSPDEVDSKISDGVDSKISRFFPTHRHHSREVFGAVFYISQTSDCHAVFFIKKI